MPTQTGPDISAGSFLDQFGAFALDVGRARLIDVEQPQDDNNIPDRVDVRTGNAPAQSQDALGGSFLRVVKQWGPFQWGGLLVAGGLSWALVTGKFRKG